MNCIDLRDLEGGEKEKRKKEVEDQLGYDFDELAKNEPTMIPEVDFEDYARELAEDIGAIKNDANWPNYCIDWEKAASELKMDYSEIEVDGVTYLFRAY